MTIVDKLNFFILNCPIMMLLNGIMKIVATYAALTFMLCSALLTSVKCLNISAHMNIKNDVAIPWEKIREFKPVSFENASIKASHTIMQAKIIFVRIYKKDVKYYAL